MKKFLFFTMIILLLPLSAMAQDISKPNGLRTAGVFNWSNGGGDPYQGTFAHALDLIGVPLQDRAALQTKVATTSGQQYTIQDGDRFQTMVSGQKGWVTTNVMAKTDMWQSARTHAADLWYYTNPQGVQYRVVRARVCGNWMVDVYGAPNILNCRCHVASGDAC
jgi:hypothetical protein